MALEIPHEYAIEHIYAGRLVGAALFANAAVERLGAKVDWIARSRGVIVSDGREIAIDGPALNESALGAAIVTDKELTKKFLLEHAIDTPRGMVVHSEDEAVKAATALGGVVVLKPVSGGQGHGVTVGVSGDSEVREAYHRAVRARRSPVLVEEHLDIENEYRCMATPNGCVAVVHRVLPRVVGDGESDVRKLVLEKNCQRKKNPAVHNLPIPIDDVTVTVLSRQGLSLSSVPRTDQVVLVRDVGGLSGGGEPHEVLDRVSTRVWSVAVAAIAAIPGLNWGGVDVATERSTGRPYVIEINCRAGYGAATFPMQGTPRDVASIALRHRLRNSKPDGPPPCTKIGRLQSDVSIDFVQFGIESASSSVSLSELFVGWLRSKDFHIDEAGRSVIRVVGPKIDTWLTRALASENDLLAARGMIGKHTLVRSLLARKDVPRVRGVRAQNVDYVRSLVKGKQREVLAIPVSQPWGSDDSVRISAKDTRWLFDSRRKWFVQLYPDRPRVRVLVSRARAFAIIASEGTSPLSANECRYATEIAIAAVRAVPELRWVAVDLVRAPQQSDARSAARCWHVEGLTLCPRLTEGDLVLAGEVEEFFEFLLESSRP